MNPSLQKNTYFVKEHVGMFKAANNFDILDPETGEPILLCREENLGFFTKMLRFSDYKRMTPFCIEIQTASGETLITVKRGVSLFLSKVEVFDSNNRKIGGFQQKLFSIGGAFKVLGSNDQPLCEMKGNMVGWNFRFLAGDNELANVSKKWAGVGKELFTSADNYILSISDQVPADQPVRQLMLAAVLCIDMVLKE